MADESTSEQARQEFDHVVRQTMAGSKAKSAEEAKIVEEAKDTMEMVHEMFRETLKVSEKMPTLSSNSPSTPPAVSTDDVLTGSLPASSSNRQQRRYSGPYSAPMDGSPSPTFRRKRFDRGNRVPSMPITLDVGDRESENVSPSKDNYALSPEAHDLDAAKEQQRLLEEQLHQTETKLTETKSKFDREREKEQSYVTQLEKDLEEERKTTADTQEELKIQKASNTVLQKECDELQQRLFNQNEKDTELLDLDKKLNEKKQRINELEHENRQIRSELSNKESSTWSMNKTMEDMTIVMQNKNKELLEESTQQKELYALLFSIAKDLTRLQEDYNHGRPLSGMDGMLIQLTEVLGQDQESDNVSSHIHGSEHFIHPANWTGDTWTILDEYLRDAGLRIIGIDKIEDAHDLHQESNFLSKRQTFQSISTQSSDMPNLFDELAKVGDDVRSSIYSQVSHSRIPSATGSIGSRLDAPGSFLSPTASIKPGWPEASALAHFYGSTKDRLEDAVRRVHIRQDLQPVYIKARKTFEKITGLVHIDKRESLKFVKMIFNALLWLFVFLIGTNVVLTMTQPYSTVGAFGFGGPDVDNFTTRLIAKVVLWCGGRGQAIWT
jgi:hypothetical protein